MRLLVPILLLAATPALAGEPARSSPVRQARCAAEGRVIPVTPGRSSDARPRRLADQPAANHELTVLRRVDGCPVPVVVRYGLDEPVERASVRRKR